MRLSSYLRDSELKVFLSIQCVLVLICFVSLLFPRPLRLLAGGAQPRTVPGGVAGHHHRLQHHQLCRVALLPAHAADVLRLHRLLRRQYRGGIKVMRFMILFLQGCES